MTEQQGRSVLVTGGNRGIGLAIARRFAAAGDKVAVTYRTSKPEGDFLAVQCDVTSTEDVERAFKEVEATHGKVQVLVANAGVTNDKPAVVMTEEDFTSVLDTNLTGAFRTAKRALRGMLRTGGRIILISSTVATLGEGGQANYAASKAGLIGLGNALAREYGPRGITTNVVAPGLTETDMSRELSEEQRSKLVQRIPAGRLAQPEEIADAVFFVAGNAYLNGVFLRVDGGAGMGH